MNRFVRISKFARKDIKQICNWIAQRSPRGAASWYKAFWGAADGISSAAEGCMVAPESNRLQRDLQQAIFKTPRGRPYRIVFQIVDSDVVILRIRGPGQRALSQRDLPKE